MPVALPIRTRRAKRRIARNLLGWNDLTEFEPTKLVTPRGQGASHESYKPATGRRQSRQMTEYRIQNSDCAGPGPAHSEF